MFRRHRLFLHTVYCIVAEPPRPIFLSAGGLCTVLGSHAQVRTWGLMGGGGTHTAPPSCCKHETQGVLAEPASGAECECNGEMLPSYLSVSIGETNCLFILPISLAYCNGGRGVYNNCKCSRCRPR